MQQEAGDMGDVMGPVPAHTYARLRFDDAAEQAVQHLSNVLQWHRGSPYEGQFVSQMEPRAGRVFPIPGNTPRTRHRTAAPTHHRRALAPWET